MELGLVGEGEGVEVAVAATMGGIGVVTMGVTVTGRGGPSSMVLDRGGGGGA